MDLIKRKTDSGVSITSKDGVEVYVPIDTSNMSDAEREAYHRFSATGDQKTLSEAELRMLGERKIYARGDDASIATICRFDWSCFNI